MCIRDRYLLACYFPRTHRIMEGEGVIMRQYLIGEADHALLNAMTGRADAFYRRFFGREAPVLPGIEQLAFEEKWRAVQMLSLIHILPRFRKAPGL